MTKCEVCSMFTQGRNGHKVELLLVLLLLVVLFFITS